MVIMMAIIRTDFGPQTSSDDRAEIRPRRAGSARERSVGACDRIMANNGRKSTCPSPAIAAVVQPFMSPTVEKAARLREPKPSLRDSEILFSNGAPGAGTTLSNSDAGRAILRLRLRGRIVGRNGPNKGAALVCYDFRKDFVNDIL